jgi:hypothetical protein
MRRTLAAAGLLIGSAGGVAAQTAVGDDLAGGLAWHVAAPGGARWALDCRFTPATYTHNQYERRWANRMRLEGTGPQGGRLPVDNGRCTVTKTGGAGPVAIAVARGTEVVADGAAGVGEPARVGLL